MRRKRLLAIVSLVSMGSALTIIPMGNNPAHAGPEFSNSSSAHTRKSITNAQRMEAAKRAMERRAAAQKAEGGSK